MVAHRSDIWVPPPSKRALLRCSGVLALMLLATLATHIVVAPTSTQAQPGLCQRAAALPASLPR